MRMGWSRELRAGVYTASWLELAFSLHTDTVLYCTVLYCTVLYCTVLYLHTDTQLISARERCSLLADFCPNMDRVPNSTWTNHSSVLS